MRLPFPSKKHSTGLWLPTMNRSGLSVAASTLLTLFLCAVTAGFEVNASVKDSSGIEFAQPNSVVSSIEISRNHPVHFTKGELIYNEKEKSYQCVLCIYEQDLIRALKRHADVDHVWIDKRKQCEPILESYIEEEFRLLGKDGKPLKFQWAGYEADLEGVWVYFEYPMEKPPVGLKIENHLLTAVNPQTSSFLVTKWGWRRQFLTFHPQKTVEKITFVFKKLKQRDKDVFQHKHAGSNKVRDTSWPIHDAPPKPIVRYRTGNSQLLNQIQPPAVSSGKQKNTSKE